MGDVLYLSLPADRNTFSVFGFTCSVRVFSSTAFPRLGGLPGQSVCASLSLSLAAAAARPPAFACHLPAAACRPLPPFFPKKEWDLP